MDTLGASPQPADLAVRATSRCVFCCEEIQSAASICPHCRSNLVPIQRLADERAALEERVAILERELATLRDPPAGVAQNTAAGNTAPGDIASGNIAVSVTLAPAAPGRTWPHMADNIFLGLAVLIAAHWLATTLPMNSRAVFRLVALVVALPFGYRFERNSRSPISVQVVSALGFACFGTIAIGLLDIATGNLTPKTMDASDIVASVAAIALSHFAGSAWAASRQSRADQAASVAAAASSGNLLTNIKGAQIKSTAETVKALYDAVAPIVAGSAAVWAAFSHIMS